MKSRTLLAKVMTVAIFAGVTVSASMVLPHKAIAQSTAPLQNTIPASEAVTLQAKIRSIDPATRAVKLVGPTGDSLTVIAGPLVRLQLLKVGQTVNAKYYRSVAFIVNPPQGGNGVPVSNDQFSQVTAQPVEAPGGVAIRMIKISGTVVGIDLSSNTIKVVNPSGGQVYTLDVTDPARVAALGSLNVGDTISAVISQVLAVSIEPAPKSWF